jgi:hypothetical protein
MTKQHATTLRFEAYLMGKLTNVIWGDDWDVKYIVNNSTNVTTLFWKSVRMRLTLPKWGLGSPLGLSKV